MKVHAKKPVVFMLVVSGLILLFFLLLQVSQVIRFREYLDVLFPIGFIGIKEINLLIIIQILMLIIVIPVYVFTFVFSWKYRADNTKAKYDPDLVDNLFAEVIWWGVPLILTITVGVITWIKTHELDPFKPIPSKKKEMTIQVVALQWKWLFIYPEQQIASVNYLPIPVNTPIKFEITADAPMNSFWIPSLGGQIYAMPKMKTILNLIADKVGDYRGSSANISGEGFASMNFMTHVSTEDEFQKWIDQAKASENQLNKEEYSQLVKPGKGSVVTYQLKENDLFNQIINKYMLPVAKE